MTSCYRGRLLRLLRPSVARVDFRRRWRRRFPLPSLRALTSCMPSPQHCCDSVLCLCVTESMFHKRFFVELTAIGSVHFMNLIIHVRFIRPAKLWHLGSYALIICTFQCSLCYKTVLHSYRFYKGCYMLCMAYTHIVHL